MFSIEYINIPTLIAILVIAYLMDDVFLFMKLGNDTTKQLMATVVGYIIAVRKFGYLRFEPFATVLGKRILCMQWDLCGKNLRNPNGPHIREEFFSGRRLRWYLQLCPKLHLYCHSGLCLAILKL